MAFYVFIPARYQSSRLPGKPLIDLDGKSMIQRVYERAALSDATGVFVATDDERIAGVVEAFGGEYLMTSENHPTGTDRIHEAVSLSGISTDSVVVNVQGDEPMMPPAVINQVAAAITDSTQMATLCEPITRSADVFDPNIVKVVPDGRGRALYFSRAPVPWSRDTFNDDPTVLPDDVTWFRHLGIYAYTVRMLEQFVNWPEAPLEKAEKLEQLRVLANGEAIAVEQAVASIPPGIDVAADIERTLEAIRLEASR